MDYKDPEDKKTLVCASALIDEIRADMGKRRAYVISIDGVDYSGKSTLGRRLAHDLEIPLIETDLFLRGESTIDYYYDALEVPIQTRLKGDRPVIVEGILIQQILEKLGVTADYKIFCKQAGRLGSLTWKAIFAKYYSEFKPKSTASFVYSWCQSEHKTTDYT